MAERRRNKRVVPPQQVVGLVKASVPVRVLDLSVEGVQVELDAPLRPRAECDLAIQLHGTEVRLQAEVRRCRATTVVARGGAGSRLVYRAGLSFVASSDEDLQLLEDAIVDFTLSEAGIVAAGGSGDDHLTVRIDHHLVGNHSDD